MQTWQQGDKVSEVIAARVLSLHSPEHNCSSVCSLSRQLRASLLQLRELRCAGQAAHPAREVDTSQMHRLYNTSLHSTRCFSTCQHQGHQHFPCAKCFGNICLRSKLLKTTCFSLIIHDTSCLCKLSDLQGE